MSRLFLIAISMACCRLKKSGPSCGLTGPAAFPGSFLDSFPWFCGGCFESEGAGAFARAVARGVCGGCCAAAADTSTQLTAKPLKVRWELRRSAECRAASSIEQALFAARGSVLLILSTLIASLPSRTGICTDALLAGRSRLCDHVCSLLHGVIGVHHDEVTVLQASGD